MAFFIDERGTAGQLSYGKSQEENDTSVYKNIPL